MLQPGDRLVADANTGWLMHDAMRVVRAVRDVDVYIEQPCLTYEECLAVRRHTDHPFVLDESDRRRRHAAAGHADRAMDVVNIKISKFGGLTKARQARDLCVSLGIAMTIEDSWGGDIVTAAIAHLAHSTPPEFLFTSTDFNSYVTVSTADGAPQSGQRPHGRLDAAGPGHHAEDGRAGQAGGDGGVRGGGCDRWPVNRHRNRVLRYTPQPTAIRISIINPQSPITNHEALLDRRLSRGDDATQERPIARPARHGRHLEALIDSGVSGLIMCGSLGENQTLDPEEKRDVVRCAVETARGRIPVLSGVAESSTAAAIRYVADVKALGGRRRHAHAADELQGRPA